MTVTLERGDQTIELAVHGSGARAVLLLHNLLCSREVFAGQIERLSASHRVIALDLRGHGGSRAARRAFSVRDLADDAIAALDHLGIEAATVVGVSLGATVAMELALTHPGRVGGLVLMGASARAASLDDRIQNTLLAAFVRGVGLTPFVLRQVLPILFGRSFLEAGGEVLEAWKTRLRGVDRRGTWHAVRCWVTRPDHTERLHEIEARTMVVVGDEDASHPPPLGELIASKIPGATVARLHAGHSMTVEQPAAAAELLERFLSAE